MGRTIRNSNCEVRIRAQLSKQATQVLLSAHAAIGRSDAIQDRVPARGRSKQRRVSVKAVGQDGG